MVQISQRDTSVRVEHCTAQLLQESAAHLKGRHRYKCKLSPVTETLARMCTQGVIPLSFFFSICLNSNIDNEFGSDNIFVMGSKRG